MNFYLFYAAFHFQDDLLSLLLTLASHPFMNLLALKFYDFVLFYFRFGHCKYVIIHYISPTSLPSCIKLKCIWEIQMKGISRAAPELVSKIANDLNNQEYYISFFLLGSKHPVLTQKHSVKPHTLQTSTEKRHQHFTRSWRRFF